MIAAEPVPVADEVCTFTTPPASDVIASALVNTFVVPFVPEFVYRTYSVVGSVPEAVSAFNTRAVTPLVPPVIIVPSNSDMYVSTATDPKVDWIFTY